MQELFFIAPTATGTLSFQNAALAQWSGTSIPFGTYLLGDLKNGRYSYPSNGREAVKKASTTSFNP